MIDNRAKMTPISYIGKSFDRHPDWVDRLYGTGIIWTPENNVQMVPNSVAQRMLKLNSDCYKLASVADVKSNLLSTGNNGKVGKSATEIMISNIDDVKVLIEFSKTLDGADVFSEETPIGDIKKDLIKFIRAKEGSILSVNNENVDELVARGEKVLEEMAKKDQKDLKLQVAKQDLQNIIMEMDNKDSLAEYAMGTPELEGVVIDKRKPIEAIKESILKGLRDVGKVF